MENIRIWIPAISTVVVALVAGFAGYLTAGWRVREVRVAYEQKIRDNYLENARKVSEQVYVPLAIAVSALSKAYSEFRVHVDFEGGPTPPGAVNRFKGACGNFQNAVSQLMSRGASAYLTLSLEEEIQDFALFLQESLNTRNIKTKTTLGIKNYDSSGISVHYGEIKIAISIIELIKSILLEIVSISTPGVSIELKSHEEAVAIPITSRDFEQKFQKSTILISALIKEVTLGSKSAPR